MTKKFLLAVLAYVALSFAIGAPWHFILFKDVYHELGIYNRAEPIIPLGLLSMFVQGAIIALLYPYFGCEKTPIRSGLAFGGLMGLFLFSVSTLANAAKIQVSSIELWLTVQSTFHLIQFAAAGAAIGWIYGSDFKHAGRSQAPVRAAGTVR
ncbi:MULTISPECIES: hypothetical protein [Methylocaldum]|jgi:hypothetical protein|uniref:hypothetical protein n=1 Tax=unclassified Methylocaldum TaxID=2622260 RepID=UPI0010DFBD23|nr:MULTISPECIES: hypothetical protein [unclassified Methylocaldum]MBP1150612.1 hypothetical protein [Methylocaldum sp. RMAD-M]MDV3241227.1 hypothetical protein [Methylocaldum sp.]